MSLAREGVMEAQAAGRLLKAHGFAFDVVYTRYVRALDPTLHFPVYISPQFIHTHFCELFQLQ